MGAVEVTGVAVGVAGGAAEGGVAARPVAAHVSRQRALNIALECWRPLTPSPNTLCGVEPELLHKRDKEYSRVALGHHGALRSGHDGEQLASDVDNLRPHTRSTLLYQLDGPPVPSAKPQAPTGAAPNVVRSTVQ